MKTFITVLILSTSIASAQSITQPPDASPNVKLAAKEIRRYVYLRTGELLPIAQAGKGIMLQVDKNLEAQQYRLKSEGDSLMISGGSDVAVLYGAYAFVEKLGVRFYLHGDVIPDEKIPFTIPKLDETCKPLFELRGLQPFHDFPEGPDWWTLDEWKSIVAQATKMRMNFIGLHTYPYHNTTLGPEPTVWVGLAEDVNADGTVKRSAKTSWYTTAKYMPYGCYAPMKTGDYAFGGDQVFPTDNYGSPVNGPGDFPFPKTEADAAALMNRTGRMLNEIVTTAHQRGMKVAVGTEAMRRKANQALDIPDHVVEQLKAENIVPTSQAAMQRVYEGMFTRIARACPVDYYWIWGYEGDIEEQVFVDDLLAANAARRQVNAPFELGVCGWGWTAGHFPGLDKALPKELFFSAINASVGSAPVSVNFGKLGNRPRWAIPWFENDGHMTSLQLRTGRMRRDAVDARRYGCTGLMGIFWRTRILSPNIAALAQAGWEQGAWSRPSAVKGEKRDVEVIGGEAATYLNDAVAGTNNDPIYQTVRYNLRGYRFAVPNGQYTVTLRFVEPVNKEAGKRVFGVKLQDRQVIEHLDIFAAVGQFKALDRTFPNIAVTDGVLRIDFTCEVGGPCIAALDLTGNGVTRKVNCGGPAYQDYAADASSEKLPRDLPTGDFYTDWATAQFGRKVGPAAATIFSKLDGNFPAPSGWIRGPGAIVVNKQPWAKIATQYAFVDHFAALRPRVKGAGNLERFDWWLNTFRVTRFMGQFGCARGELDAIMDSIAKQKDPNKQRQLARKHALPVRLRMVTLLGDLHNALLATLHNATELGTLCNIEQQSMLRLKLLTGHDAALEILLGQPLPAAARPWKDYRGKPHLVVMNARTMAQAGEALTLDIIALDKQPVKSVVVYLRPLGKGEWQTIPATHVARAVYQAKLPAAQEDFEYYVTAGENLLWPATAPQINQTVVITE